MRSWSVLWAAGCAVPELERAEPAPREIPASYQVTDLGVVSGQTQSRAWGINHAGQVTGESRGEDSLDPILGFFWSEEDGLVDLGVPAGYTDVMAADLAPDGRVVGTVVDAAFNERAFVWEAGVFELIEPLPGDDYTLGVDINARGDVVGQSGSRGFLRRGERMRELPPLAGGDIAFVNVLTNGGDIAGLSSTSTGEIVAVMWTERGTVLTDMGSMLSSPDFQPFDLAPSGEMVGWSPSVERAMLLQGGVLTELGSLPGGTTDAKAMGVNKHLEVVGNASSSTGSDHAFLWVDGTLVDLNDHIDASLGWELREATAINAHGQICGAGMIGGEEHAFLLTPQ